MKRAGVFVIAFALASVLVWYFARNEESRGRGTTLQSRETAARMLGEYLAKKFSGARVLVISNPFTRTGASRDTQKMENAGIEGLREGFGDRTVLKVGFPELKPAARTDPRSLLADPETPTPLSYLVTEDAFDKLTPGYDLAISLIGLPEALDKVQCWQNPGKPVFALLLPDLRMVGTGADVRAAVKMGKLAAFVLPAPNAANQFLLVTPESIDQLGQQYPRLLGPD